MTGPDPKPPRTPRGASGRRAAREAALPIAEAREVVLRRSEGECEIAVGGCLTRGVQMHHRKRRKDGGNSPSNLLAACGNCHDLIHANPASAYMNGWIVPTHDDPLQVPVMYRTRSFVMLTDNGEVRSLP